MSIRNIIFEDFESSHVSAVKLDDLLAKGWRHAGEHFYRYNFAFHRGALTEVIPLRIVLDQFTPSKSQRKVRNRNLQRGWNTTVRPAEVDSEKEALFQQHKSKFEDNVPEHLYDFLSREPDRVPCECYEVSVYDQDCLIAASFFDVGENCVSTVYGMYDLDYTHCGLGIFTMLLEIEHAKALGKAYYYHGYCYRCASFYDYKKRFRALEAFDWGSRWLPWAEVEQAGENALDEFSL